MFCYFIIFLLLRLQICSADLCTTEKWCAEEAEEMLLIDLFKDYKNMVRPMVNGDDSVIVVKIGLQLQLLVNIDELNQIMHTNVWIPITWTDPQLVWRPELYSNITQIQIPPDKVWLPDIVLFNNADGKYDATYWSNVLIKYDGSIQWIPPAIYKSSCRMDVEMFPFDDQECEMVMGSWTYNADEIRLEVLSPGIDLSQFQKSTIWDVFDVPASINPLLNQAVFVIIVKRKALFYSWVLLIPSVLLAFISCMVFYMPTESREKIGLSIYILLSIDFFLVMVSKVLPQTSLSVPLVAKYQVLTLGLNVVTIFVQVIIINVYYRGPDSHTMPNYVQYWILGILAKLMLMKRPTRKTIDKFINRQWAQKLAIAHATKVATSAARFPVPGMFLPDHDVNQHHPKCPFSALEHQKDQQLLLAPPSPPMLDRTLASYNSPQSGKIRLTADTADCIGRMQFITRHMKDDTESRKITDDWKYAGMVLDRLALYVFLGVTLGGTIGIIFATDVFETVDQDKRIEWLQIHYNWTDAS